MNTLKFLQKRSNLLHRVAPYSWLDDRYWIEYTFLRKFGYRLNLKDPKTFNEKLNWMKLYDRNPLYTTLADKYRVKEYIEKEIGPGYTTRLYAVYKNAEEIEWDQLPAEYVIKTNHGAGMILYNDGNRKLDRDDAIRKLNRWMTKNFYQQGREWQYKNIEPRIIIEERIVPETDYGVRDYKFYCFNGETEMFYVNIDRYNNQTQLFLDMDWKPLEMRSEHLPRATKPIPKPENFSEMVEIARILTKGLRFCRLDLYNEGKILFGEFTLTPLRGFKKYIPAEYDLHLGSFLDTSWKYQARKA